MMAIWVTTDFESLHRWPAAEDPVGFLAYPHRHSFKVKVELEVQHNDRNIEFLSFKRFLTELCRSMWNMDSITEFSCETMANILQVRLSNYPLVSITISEDGENGATWYRDHN